MPRSPRPDPRGTTWKARLIAVATAAAGITAILSALGLRHRYVVGLNELINPAGYRFGARTLEVALGIGLLYLAGNLARGKRMAWNVSMVLFGLHGLTSLAHLVVSRDLNRPADWMPLLVSIAMLVLLGSSRAEFPARPDPPSLTQVARFVPTYFGLVLAYGVAALWLERNHVTPSFGWGRALATAAGEMVAIDTPLDYQRHTFAVYFPRSMIALCIAGVAITLFLLLRTVVAQPRTTAEWERAQRLVHRWGTDTLSYFALRNDKSYFFSSDGEAMIAYCYLGGYALASGDPIGRPESFDLVVEEFLEMCSSHGWGQAFLAVREEEAPRYERLGLRTFYLGDEAVIHTDEFSLAGKKNKSMRQSVGRVARTYHLEVVPESEAGPELTAELNEISAKWRGKAPERGFTMALGRDVGGSNPDFLLCIARGEDGRAGGFLRIVPVVGDAPGELRGYTLDMMRRDPDTPNGMTEFLVANTVAELRERGIGVFSMNFAVMGRLFSEDIHFSPGQRLMKAIVSLFNPFFQIRSLHEFNRRFRPRWQGRVCMYDDRRSLPHLALLYGGVEGFLGVPVIGRLFVPVAHDPIVTDPIVTDPPPPTAPGSRQGDDDTHAVRAHPQVVDPDAHRVVAAGDQGHLERGGEPEA